MNGLSARTFRSPRSVQAHDAFHAGRDMDSGSHAISSYTVALLTLHERMGRDLSDRVPADASLAQLAAGNIVALSRMGKDAQSGQ